jgi:hypothetical protein
MEELLEVVFYTQSVPRLYNSDLLAMKNSREIGASQQGLEPWNTEAEDIVGIRCQATPVEHIEDLVCAIMRSNVCELAIVS